MKRLTHRLWIVEAAAFLSTASLALRVLPFRVVARLAGGVEGGQPAGPVASDPQAMAIGRAVSAAARHLPWHPQCLPQALAAAFMLRLRAIPSHLCLGVRLEGGVIKAHAWLMVGGPAGGVVCGGPGAQHFAPVVAPRPASAT